MSNCKIKAPFFEIGPKSYLYGDDVLNLAKAADRASKKYDVDIIFTCPIVDIRRVKEHTKRIHVFAPHMDPLVPGRGRHARVPAGPAETGAVLGRLPLRQRDGGAKRGRLDGLRLRGPGAAGLAGLPRDPLRALGRRGLGLHDHRLASAPKPQALVRGADAAAADARQAGLPGFGGYGNGLPEFVLRGRRAADAGDGVVLSAAAEGAGGLTIFI